MKKLIFPILVIGIVIFGLFFYGYIYAQVGKGVGISPLTFEITANPGEVFTNQVKVYNPSDSIIGVKMEIEDFTVTGEIGHVITEPAETETYSIARWINFEPNEFTLQSGEQKFVNFTISVPQNAEPGGHYGAVLAGTTAVIGAEFVGTAVATRVGSLVLLTVSGPVKEDVRIKEFLAPRYSEYGPIKFTIRFENKGTVHVKPKAIITITNWLGKKIADVEVPQNNVLPNSVRRMETVLNKKWLWSGKYTATLTGNYGISNNYLIPTVITFWAFPWKIGLGILIVIIFFILTRKRWIAALRVLIKGERKI